MTTLSVNHYIYRYHKQLPNHEINKSRIRDARRKILKSKHFFVSSNKKHTPPKSPTSLSGSVNVMHSNRIQSPPQENVPSRTLQSHQTPPLLCDGRGIERQPLCGHQNNLRLQNPSIVIPHPPLSCTKQIKYITKLQLILSASSYEVLPHNIVCHGGGHCTHLDTHVYTHTH